MKKKLGLILMLCFLAGELAPAIAVQTGDALTVGGGARALGMGKTFTAVADDADAMFYNAGGNAGLKGPQGMAMFTNLMGDTYYSEYCGAIPAPWGNIGLGYIMTGVNQIPSTSPSGFFDYYDNVFVMNYSTPLARFFGYGNNIFVGVNGKIFNRGYTGAITKYASGFSADFGVKYILNPTLSLGLSYQNFIPVSMGSVLQWGSGVEESFAGMLKTGFALRPAQNRSILIAGDLDLPTYSARPVTGHLGIEWTANDALILRTGLDQNIDATTASKTSWNPTFGLSLSYTGFRVDYAYHQYYNNPGLATSYVSISYTSEPWLALKGGPLSLPQKSSVRQRR